MLTIKERARMVAITWLGTVDPGVPVLARRIEEEIEEANAEAIELVRQMRARLAVAGVGEGELISVADEFLRAHGVEVSS